MARLPVPGSDDGTWGSILNDFLDVEHTADGSLRNVARPADLDAKQNTSEKGQPGGYAALDASGLVDSSHLPAGTAAVTSVAGKTGDVVIDASDVQGLNSDLAAKQDVSQKGKPDGYAGLNSEGLIDGAFLPPSPITVSQTAPPSPNVNDLWVQY